MITFWNTYRDKLNELGCQRFSTENSQKLTTFYSVDKWKTDNKEQKGRPKRNRVKVDPSRKSNRIGPVLQQILWNLPPGCTKHPGKLSLCVGMPVMIKKNKATECSVTNGAEDVVAGWTTRTIDAEHTALEVLFVQLTSPPKPLQLEGLPLNVVPVGHETINVACNLPDGQVLNISRDQVPVVLNFEMTDFWLTRQNSSVQRV